MRKLTILLGLLLIAGELRAQTDEPALSGKNELRLNMLNTLLGSIEPQYERLFDDNSALNIFLGIGYQQEISALITTLILHLLTGSILVRNRVQDFF